jgi:hypothetical protein
MRNFGNSHISRRLRDIHFNFNVYVHVPTYVCETSHAFTNSRLARIGDMIQTTFLTID